MSEPTSPRIEALIHEIDAGNRQALDAFWARLEEESTPIVEPIDGDENFRALTFVCRDGRPDTVAIDLEGGPAASPRHEIRRLARIEGTDVWFKTFRVRADIRANYEFSRVDVTYDPGVVGEDGERAWPISMPDPLNPNRLAWPAYDRDPTDRGSEGSVIELADTPPQRWAAPRPGVATGLVEEHSFRSEALGNERRVWVYRPATPAATDPSPVMVLLDGWEWNVALPIAPSLDNLIAAGAIPPLVVVMPESLGHPLRGIELPCHEPFVEFLAAELLPWARERWDVTTDPARTIVGGQSFGGLASAFAGLRRPDVFGKVISQSGAFWWKADTEFDVEAEWLVRRFATEPAVPVRVWLEIGLLEGSGMLAANRHLRDVLEAKGYDVTYMEYNHDHWWPSWLATLPDALQSIAGGWAAGSGDAASTVGAVTL